MNNGLRSPYFISELKKLLEQECRCHDRYIKLLKEEQSALSNFDPITVTELTEKRGAVCAELEQIQEQRKSFLSEYPEAHNVKLSELITKQCGPAAVATIVPLVNKLKDRITVSRTLGTELKQIVDFSMTFVNGAKSLMRSATHNVNRTYSRKGTTQELIEGRGVNSLKEV